MSLEAAGFIKDLVATNPLGTDPKSQGDDHMRLIKSVLKGQFSGFTDGIPITLTETILNGLGASGVGGFATAFTDANAIPFKTGFYAVYVAATNLPPNAAVGDTVIMIAASATVAIQIYTSFQAANLIWTRAFSGATWSPWKCQSSIGVGQTWQNMSGSRATNTVYTNNTGRSIQVCFSGQGNNAIDMWADAIVNGVFLTRMSMTALYSSSAWAGIKNCTTFIVPDGNTYQVGVSAPTSIVVWSELR